VPGRDTSPELRPGIDEVPEVIVVPPRNMPYPFAALVAITIWLWPYFVVPLESSPKFR
jgi:hypothetical protein